MSIGAGQTTLQSEDLVIDEFRDVALQFDGNWSARLPVIGGFDLENGATLETWIAPNWAKSPEEDPCIFSLLEDGATVLAVHVDNELNYIGLRSGNSYGGYSVDIDPSVLNHLAVATFGGYWDVYWNGEPSGMIALPVLSAQADELVVGGCGAEDQSYVGWISNFRLWNTIVFWDDVYAFMPVTTNILDEGHPMQPFIRAMTRVHENGTPYITTLNGVTAEQEQ